MTTSGECDHERPVVMGVGYSSLNMGVRYFSLNMGVRYSALKHCFNS